ncbi:MAG: DUF2726 domain-containing protein [Elusimicrobiota bacterium]
MIDTKNDEIKISEEKSARLSRLDAISDICRRLKEKMARMDAVVDNFRTTFLTLPYPEFRFLGMLACEKDLEPARRRFGVSKEIALSLVKKFDRLDYLFYFGEVFENAYIFNPTLQTVFERLGQRKTRPIMETNKVFGIYLELKKQHEYVFPEMQLSAFIERKAVEHLFTEKWHRGYFLTCRVDFLICNYDGSPIFAVEVDGTYHQDEDMKIKDAFKEKVITEAGLRLERIK